MVVSNDTYALFYCIIAANKRDCVISNEFSKEFWLEIVYTSKATAKTCSKNNSFRILEY